MKARRCYSSGNSLNRLNVSLCSVALLLGGIIYILFRTSEPLFFTWISGAGPDSWLYLVRHRSISLSQFLPEWIVFSLPNGLWAFAYALLITGIWAGNKSQIKIFWIASIPVLVLGFEILQFAGTLPGVFCLQDMAFGIAGMIIGIFTGTKTFNPNHYENASQ